MGERRDGAAAAAAAAAGGTGLHLESEESSSLLRTAVSVLQSSYLDRTSRDGFQYSQAILVENDVFLNELRAFAQAKEAAGYSQEELEETFAFLLFDNEDEAKEVCQTGLRINTSSISTLGDPAKGVYISKYADCLRPRPWHHGKSGYIVIFKLIKGKVKAVCENHTTSYTCPSPGYDCHIAVSRNTVTSRTSPFQAFERSQYYVYEVSGGSVAERPRQICPYMVIACQYQEPKGMPLLARERLADLNHKASYCPWRGQLCIQGQPLCSIALRTPFSSTIPAQLPPNLDMNHVMALSDLKKKLPEAAFGKSNYVGNEVCFQGIYFSLYEVEITSKEQHKMDELLQNLKEKDLAIIKYLQDRGVLILLPSAALTQDDAFDPEESSSLLALFLFASSRSLCPRVDKRDPKAEREDGDISLRIASVLPGLQYAVRKATKSSHGDTGSPSVRIKRHFQEFAKLEQNAQPTSGQNSPVPLPSLLSPTENEGTNHLTKCSEQSFSQLQRYLSDPSSYSLEISAALGCLAGAAQSLGCSSEAVCNVDFSVAVPPDPVPPSAAALKIKNETPKAAAGLTQGGKGTSADVNSANKLRVQQSKRKSSQTIVSSSRKKWSPLKMQIHAGGDGGRSRNATKKKKINFAFPKKPGLAAGPGEPMLKLAHLQFPHRRKRGAEVLSAEFVHKTQAEPVQEAAGSPAPEAKRAKMLQKPDGKKVPSAQAAPKPLEKKMIKSPSKPQAKKQVESEPKELLSILPSETLYGNRGAPSAGSGIYPTKDVALRGDSCEPHALNLLADLALGSCIPALVPAATEQQSQRRPRAPRSAFDHEYHRVDRLPKEGSSPCNAAPSQRLEKPAGKMDLKKDSVPAPREKSPGVSSKKSSPSPSSAKPGEAQEAVEGTKPSFISSEHSYASQLPEHARKPPYPRGMLHPMALAARNGARSARPGPPVGTVLPLQRGGPGARRPAVARPREEFARTHTVRRCGGSITVTCRCDTEYLFSLDSRYTRDDLEKSVIRALHGPWDPDLPDDVEETKLILHMWLALFYSKPSKLLSNTRKVVEHSNPKKFVSINSTGDFLELSDDSEDCFVLETCPADSQSDPDRIPEPGARSQGTFCTEKSPADSQTDMDGTQGVVDSTVSSSVGELPCAEEPSSTSCPEIPSLSAHADGSSPEDTPEESPREGLLDATVAPGPSEELGDTSRSPSAVGREKPHGESLNSSGDAWSSRHSRGEPLESGCPGPPAGGVGQECCHSGPLEADPGSAKPQRAGGEGREFQDSLGQQEREEEEVEEEKKEEEDSKYEHEFLGPGILACLEGSSADTEREDREMMAANAAHPEDPAALAGLTPLAAPGPGERATRHRPCALQEPQEPRDTPGADLEPLSPSTQVIRGAIPESGEEASAEDRAPSAEGRVPAEPGTAAAAGAASALPSAPDSSPVHVVPLDRAADTEAPLETLAATAATPTLPPSVPGGDRCPSPRRGGDSGAGVTSLSAEGSNHEGVELPGVGRARALRGAGTAQRDPLESPGITLAGATGTSAAGEPPTPAPARHGHGADPCGPKLLPDPEAGTEPRGPTAGPEGQCPSSCDVSRSGQGGQQRCGVHGEVLLCAHRETSQSPERGGAADVSDALPGAKQFPGRERRAASSDTDPTRGSSCSDSDREDFGGTACPLRTSWSSYSTKTTDAAGAGSGWDASSVSSEQADGRSEGWSSPGAHEGWWQPEPPYVSITDERGVPRDYVNFTVTMRHRDAVGPWQPEQCSRHGGHSHLLKSLVGTRRTSKEVTQDTLDLECLRFHYKLNQILRSRKPSSTSESIFPKDSPSPVSPEPCPTPRSRSPLQVTLLSSATRPDGVTWRPRSRGAPGHLCKLRYDREPKAAREDIALILDEFAEFGRVMRGHLGAGLARGQRPRALPGAPRPRRRPPAFEDTIAALCSSLRSHLHRVARDAGARAGLFYLVETGEDVFFARAKTLLKKDGHKEIEPLSFCKAKRLEAERLLVVIRNEDISSHIHKVPCLLRLKRCPNVVFAGVDQPEDLPGRTYQELFHTGGFVVSDDDVLETVTPGQLKEVVKVLEKLNGGGRWKWLLHYKESKKLREDLRVDANAHKKNLILKSCQGAELVEVLHYHACDSGASPKSEYLKCLLNLQVQHISARFAVYLTEKPGLSKEIFESQGILVADVNTFLGTVQQMAAPFQRSSW